MTPLAIGYLAPRVIRAWLWAAETLIGWLS